MKRNLHLVLVIGYSGRLALFESQILAAPVPMGLIVAEMKSPKEQEQQLLEKYPPIPTTLLPIEQYIEPVVFPLKPTLHHTDRIMVSDPPLGCDCITETRCRSPGKGIG